MRKTSVYLTEDELDGLRRVSAATGRSQSVLIRDGVGRVIAEQELGHRTFRSMGLGAGTGSPTPGWDADVLYDKVMGRRADHGADR